MYGKLYFYVFRQPVEVELFHTNVEISNCTTHCGHELAYVDLLVISNNVAGRRVKVKLVAVALVIIVLVEVPGTGVEMVIVPVLSVFVRVTAEEVVL